MGSQDDKTGRDSIASISDALFFGFTSDDGTQRQPGLVEQLEMFLAMNDSNGDGQVDRHDADAPDWMEINILKAIDGMRTRFQTLVSSYDRDKSGTLDEAELDRMMDGIRRIQHEYPQFGDGLYMLTEAKLATPERFVTTQRLLDRFDEMISHGLPDASTPKQNER